MFTTRKSRIWSVEEMDKINVITISREYGSGGREIGERIAKELDIPFYDKVLIDMIASDLGMAAGYVEEASEKMSMSQAFNIATLGYYSVSPIVENVQIVKEDIFVSQSKIIKELAEKGPCVIVGRCADYILRDRKDVLNVFIHADYNFREKMAMEEYGIDEKHVHSVIKKSDKARAKHYSFYCEQKWGNVGNYHLMVDSGKFGIEKAVNLIIDAVKNSDK